MEKLKSSFTNRPGSNINTKTINGAYGGFKYPTWGKNYGGGMTSETLLHLAVREDNQCYPNRYMFVKTLVHVLKINTAVMNEHDDPARRYGETAQMLVDAGELSRAGTIVLSQTAPPFVHTAAPFVHTCMCQSTP